VAIDRFVETGNEVVRLSSLPGRPVFLACPEGRASAPPKEVNRPAAASFNSLCACEFPGRQDEAVTKAHKTCPRENTRCRQWNKFTLTEFLFSDRVELSFRGQIKVAWRFVTEGESMKRCSACNGRFGLIRYRLGQKSLLKTVPGKIRG
jgi:hypothetical protein